MAHSFAYGLRLRSNLPIPGLAAVPPADVVDVDIRLGRAMSERAPAAGCERRYVSPFLDAQGDPVVVVDVSDDTGAYLWTYSDGQRFVLDSAGTAIDADWPDTVTVEDVTLNLLGPILGFVLRLRGVTCLHASAIAVEGRALAVVGRRSSGKSTTAAALTALGYSLVSEDVVPLVDCGTHYEAVPGYPTIRLWPKSVAFLYGEGASLPLLTQNRDKRRLDLGDHGYAFQRDPLPLAAIYYLNRRSEDDRAPLVEPVSSHQALMALVGDTYTNYALSTDMRAREFDLLGRVARTVPFRSVTPHKDAARLPQLCRAILDDFERLGSQRAGDQPSAHADVARVPVA